MNPEWPPLPFPVRRPFSAAWLLAGLLAGLLGFLLSAPGLAQPLNDAERRGKALYLSGESSSGEEILALVGGDAGVEVPAGTVPCARCHGHDGRGRAEGAAAAPDITWPALTGARPPYDEGAVKQALTLGTDPTGRPLDPTMPRYRLSLRDAGDLIAYLRRIATDRDPGLGEDTLVVGTLLPGATDLREPFRAALEAAIGEVNRVGGIAGRRLELVAIPTLGEPRVRGDQVRYFFDDKKPFALVAPYLVGAETSLLDAMAEFGMPAVGALALEPQLGPPLNRQVFYLYPGRSGQARLLVDRLAAEGEQWPGEAGAWAVVRPVGEEGETLARAVTARAAERGLGEPAVLTDQTGPSDAPALAEALRERGAGAVVYLGPGPEGTALAEALGKLGAAPLLLAPGYGAGPDLLTGPPGFKGSIWVTVPTLPAALDPEAIRHLGELLGERRAENPAHATVQLAVYGAFQVFLEGLRRSGRDLSRAGLIAALEGLHRFDTGVTPPLTFGPSRRLGSRGAWLVRWDGATGKLAGPPEWVEER